MKRILNFSAKYPVSILTFLFIITIIAAFQFPKLHISISTDDIAVENDPAWIAEQNFREVFGSDKLLVVFLQDEKLFKTDKLKLIQKLSDELDKLEEIEKIESLFSTVDIKLDDDYVETKPYLHNIPDNPEQLQQVLNRATINPLVLNNIISEDGKTLTLNLTLKDSEGDNDFDNLIVSKVRAIIQNYKEHFDQASIIGSSMVSQQITNNIGHDLVTIIPLSIAVLGLILMIGLRKIRALLIPILTSLVSIIWTLAFMALLDIPLGVMTSIIPALLVIIGSTEDVHLITEYEYFRQRRFSIKEAISKMNSSMSTAILLTFITTYLGFLSILFNEIYLLKEFALVSSVGLFINFMITSLSVPALLTFTMKKSQSFSKEQTTHNLYQKFGLFILNFSRQNVLFISITLSIILLISLYGATLLKVNNNPLNYFHEDTEIVRNSRMINESLAGTQVMSIILETGFEDTFKKINYLEEIEKIQDYLLSKDEFDKSLSVVDFFKYVNFSMEGGDIDAEIELFLPDEDSQIEEYQLFIKHHMVAAFVNKDFSTSRIIVRHAIENSSELQQAVAELKQFLGQEIDPALKISITGDSVVSANAANYLAGGQVKSILIMVLVIFILASTLFINLKAGLIAIIPNLFPVIVLFGVMGWLNIPLDTGTAMVAVITLGISVDHTVHFMSRYYHVTRNQDNTDKALTKVVEEETTPIMTTSTALASGFLVFIASNFLPVVYFGFLSALVMILAVISTFVILPLLLSFTRLITMWDMLAIECKTEVIKSCPLFKGVSSWGIRQTVLCSEIKEFNHHERIITQDSLGNEMYVLLEGDAVANYEKMHGNVTVLGHLSPGDFFGEVSLVANIPRTANVDAQTNCRLLVLKWESIAQLSRIHNSVAATIYKNLASTIGIRMENMLSNKSNNLNRDDITGAFNRMFAKEQLGLELQRSKRHDERFLISYIKINYKSEETSSNVLPMVSQAIADAIRKGDVYFRWGWFSFVVLSHRIDKKSENNFITRLWSHLDSVSRSLDFQITFELAPIEIGQEESSEDIINKLDYLLLTDEKQSEQASKQAEQ